MSDGALWIVIGYLDLIADRLVGAGDRDAGIPSARLEDLRQSALVLAAESQALVIAAETAHPDFTDRVLAAFRK